ASPQPVERPSVVRGVRLDHGDLDETPLHGALAHIAPRRRSPPYPRTWSRHGVPKGLPHTTCHTTVFYLSYYRISSSFEYGLHGPFRRHATGIRPIWDVRKGDP